MKWTAIVRLPAVPRFSGTNRSPSSAAMVRVPACSAKGVRYTDPGPTGAAMAEAVLRAKAIAAPVHTQRLIWPLRPILI